MSPLLPQEIAMIVLTRNIEFILLLLSAGGFSLMPNSGCMLSSKCPGGLCMIKSYRLNFFSKYTWASGNEIQCRPPP